MVSSRTVMVVLTGAIGAAVGCRESGSNIPQPPLPTATMNLAGETFLVEVASQPEQRRRGLMDRSFLDRNAGMLFVFEDEQPQSFWMKNTLIPLDIAFIRASGRIATIRTMRTKDEALYSSQEPCLYALEVPGGTFARLGMHEADTVEIPPKVASAGSR